MCSVAALEIITMSPRGCVRIDGSTSLLHDHAPNACVRIVRSSSAGIGVGDGLAARRVPGVVHEDVDVTEVGERRARPSSRTARSRRPTPRTRRARRPSFSISATVSRGGVLVAAVVDRDVGAVLGEAERDRLADPAAAAGDQRNPSFESHADSSAIRP